MLDPRAFPEGLIVLHAEFIEVKNRNWNGTLYSSRKVS